MNHSTCSHPQVISQMPSPEAALHTSPDPSFKTTRTDPSDNVLISAWRAALNDESEPWSGEMAAAANEEVPGEVKHRPIKIHRNKNDGKIEREVKSAVKESLASETATMVGEVLDEVLSRTLHNAQSGV